MSKARYVRLPTLRHAACAPMRMLFTALVATALLLTAAQVRGPNSKSSQNLIEKPTQENEREVVEDDHDVTEAGTKLKSAENKLDSAENKLEPTENKLEPAENKLEPAENKLEPTEAKVRTRPATEHQPAWTFDFQVVLKPTECGDRGCNFSESVVICVSSAAKYIERRQAIRKTWGSNHSNRVLFFFGTQSTQQDGLREEAEKFNDIVQYDFQDSYRNLTLKSVSMLRFVDENRWPKLSYFIKADDDTFINTRNLPETLKAIADDKDRGLYGSLQLGARPIRNRKNKWYVSRDEFDEKVYPSYHSGCFYVIPVRFLKLMSDEATSVPFMYLEDAYITGLVARHAKIPRFRIRKHMIDHGPAATKAHLIAKLYVAKHYMTPARMFEAFSAQKELSR